METLHHLLWSNATSRRTIVVVDASFAEILKWNNLVLPADHAIFDLSAESSVLTAIGGQKAERLLLFLSSLEQAVLSMAKEMVVASGVPEVCVLTSIASAAIARPSASTASPPSQRPYDFIEKLLLPAQSTVHYLPMHSIDLLAASPKGALQVRILANHLHRPLNALTLGGLKGRLTGSHKSLADVNAADLPADLKASLKALSYDLAAALVFDLSLDPSSCIYALGKTAALVGHSVLTVLEGLTSLEQTAPRALAAALTGSASRPMAQCSLVLVDRLEDVFSPLTAIGTSSLAQRILNTCKLPSSNKGWDVRIDALIQPSFCSLLDDDCANHSLHAAVRTLPFTTSLSLCYRNRTGNSALATRVSALQSRLLALKGMRRDSWDDLDSPPVNDTCLLRRALFLDSEESARAVLFNVLKDLIDKEHGVFQQKKRGMGAEVHALVSALIEAPGHDADQENVPRHAVACTYNSIISVCLTIIEAMQRSAHKQFTSAYRLSYDLKQAREVHFLQALTSDGLAGALAAMASTYQALGSELTPTHQSASSPVKKGKVKKEEEDHRKGPADLTHLLCCALGLLGLSRQQEVGFSVAEALAPMLLDLLLQAREEELDSLQSLHILSPAFLQQLADNTVSKDDLLPQLLDLLAPLDELQGMYQASRSKPTAALTDYLQSADTGMPVQAAGDLLGLLGRIVRECTMLHPIDPDACCLQRMEYVESPLKQVARAGLGLLSKGLGRLGFGGAAQASTPTAHPAEFDTIVVCVLGGLSCNEAAQVQQVLDQGSGGKKIVLLSNALLSSEEMLARVFASNQQQ